MNMFRALCTLNHNAWCKRRESRGADLWMEEIEDYKAEVLKWGWSPYEIWGRSCFASCLVQMFYHLKHKCLVWRMQLTACF